MTNGDQEEQAGGGTPQFVSQPPFAPAEDMGMPPLFMPGYAAALDYLLKFEIPERYKSEFERFKPILSQALKLAYIRREDIPRYLTYLDLIVAYYKIGLPKLARKRMVRMVTELGLTCSVDGFWSKVIVTSRREQIFEGFGLPGEEKEKEKKGGGFWIFKRR